MILPKPRGELSTVLFEVLRWAPEDVDDGAEWDSTALGLRRVLERELEQRLRDRWPGNPGDGFTPDDLLAYVGADDGPSLATYV